jgi:hypothetical protein
VATVAGLEARAGGGEDPALILAACDQGMMMRARGRWMNSGAQGKHRDEPRNKFGGIYAKNSPPNQFGGIYAKDAPVNQSGGVSPDAAASGAGGPASRAATSKMSGISLDGLLPEGKGGEIASSVPAEIRAQSADDGGGIASSVPAEIGVQTGHSGTWIARSVPAQIRARAQSADDGGGIASSVPAEARARAETAYEQAYTPAPLTLLAEPYPWRAETVQGAAYVEAYTTPHGMGRTDESPYSQTLIEAYPRQIAAFFVELRSGHATPVQSAHTRAYRAYLGASPAAGDPTATVRAGGTADCPKCPTTGRSQCCCKFCISNDQQHTVRTRVSLDCKTGMTEILPGSEGSPPPEPNLCSCSFVVEGTAASFGGFGGGSSGDPSEDECTTGQASQPGWTCYIMCGGSSKTDQEWSGDVWQGVSCNCLPYSPFCIGAKVSCEECRSAAEAMASGYSQSGKIPLYCCPKPDAGFCDELRVACPCKCPPPGNCDRR